MIRRLLSLFGADKTEEESGEDGLRLAVAALLVEAGRMDQEFDAVERGTVRHLLSSRFVLTEEACDTLLEQAEAAVAQSAQLFGFTSAVVKNWDADQRSELVEMLWQVAYSDGNLDPHEDTLLRRVAGLLHVSDRERSRARRRALEKLGRGRSES